MFKNLTLTRSLIVFDLETTSADPATARIVELAYRVFFRGEEGYENRWRFNPGVPISAEATKIHGITDADVADCPPFADKALLLADVFADSDLAGFNLIRFDLRVLAEEFKRAGAPLSLDGRAIIDAMVLYHKLRPRDLSACVREFLGREHIGAHTADVDVRATVEVLDKMICFSTPDIIIPNTVVGLAEFLKDPGVVDAGGFFTKDESGTVRLKVGKHRGQPVGWVAKHDPSFLRWVIGKSPFDDSKRIAAEALDAAAGPRIC